VLENAKLCRLVWQKSSFKILLHEEPTTGGRRKRFGNNDHPGFQGFSTVPGGI